MTSRSSSLLPCINIYAGENRELRGYFGTPESFKDRSLTTREIIVACEGITHRSKCGHKEWNDVLQSLLCEIRDVAESMMLNPMQALVRVSLLARGAVGGRAS